MYAHVAYIIVMAAITLGSWAKEGGDADDRNTGKERPAAWFDACTGGAAGRNHSPRNRCRCDCGETEQNTFEMLQAAPVELSFDLVLGKLLSSLAYPLILLIAGAPMLALLCFRGDLDPAAFGRSSLLLAVSSVLIALGSLAVSSLCSRTSTALMISYLVVLVLVAGTLFPAAILLESQSSNWRRSALSGGKITVAALMSVLRPDPGDFDGQLHALPASWVIFLVLCGRDDPRLHRGALHPPSKVRHFGGSAVHRAAFTFSKVLAFGFAGKAPTSPMNAWNPVLTKERRVDVLMADG